MSEETPVKAFRLKKSLLRPLRNLLNYPLAPDKGGRTRGKFLKLVIAAFNETEKARQELAETYAEKNNENKPVLVERMTPSGPQKFFDFTPENQKKYDEANKALWEEEFVIDLLPSVEPIVKTVKDMVLKIDRALTVDEEQDYLEICEAFEKI